MIKTINTLIYYVLMALVIIFDRSNFQLYFTIVFAVMQVITIASDYIITSRIIPHEFHLVKNDVAVTPGKLLLGILFGILFLAALNLIFKVFISLQFWIFICIAVTSVLIQFLITRNKNTPTFLIQASKLSVNDIILKTYDLEALQSITFNSFNEVYLAKFSNSRGLKISLKEFRQDDLNTFLGVMKSRSKDKVLVSANIENDLTVACP